MDLKRMTRALLAMLLVCCFLTALSGCSKMENVETSSDDMASMSADSPEEVDEAAFGGEEGDETEGVLSSGEKVKYYVPAERKNPGNRYVTLFIWNVDSWKTVQYAYRDNLTVQKLLEGLAYVTNWNLSTSAVKLRDQSCTIWWDGKCSLYTGLPDKQAKEYIVFEPKDLDAAILDSVKKTIEENLGLSYTVSYGSANGGDLRLADIGVTIPVSEPYSSFWDYT